MPNRTYNSPDYRYGFNGKEKDDSGEFGNLTHYDYGFRIYNPGIARFLSVDPMAGELAGSSPYSIGLNNPIVYKDPDGKLPILPFLLKAGAAGAADMLAQAAMAYYFDPDVETVGQAFEKVNWVQVFRSSAEGLIPWRTPGGRIGKAAATASGDVMVNAINEGTGYTGEKALQDFAVGFFGDLAGGGLGELIDKYGAKKVVKALEDLGIDTKSVRELSGISKFMEKFPEVEILSNEQMKEIVGGTNPNFWKDKIIGNADVTTPGHVFRSLRIAIDAAKNSDVDKVYMDRGLTNTLRDEYNIAAFGYRIRPDVFWVTKDGKVHIREVMSKNDTRASLMYRMERAMDGIAERNRGTIDVIKPTKNE